jgi:hypothetical protein
VMICRKLLSGHLSLWTDANHEKIRLAYVRTENRTWDLPNVMIRQQQSCAITK